MIQFTIETFPMTLGRITFGLVGTVFCGSGSQTETKKSKTNIIILIIYNINKEFIYLGPIYLQSWVGLDLYGKVRSQHGLNGITNNYVLPLLNLPYLLTMWSVCWYILTRYTIYIILVYRTSHYMYTMYYTKSILLLHK